MVNFFTFLRAAFAMQVGQIIEDRRGPELRVTCPGLRIFWHQNDLAPLLRWRRTSLPEWRQHVVVTLRTGARDVTALPWRRASSVPATRCASVRSRCVRRGEPTPHAAAGRRKKPFSAKTSTERYMQLTASQCQTPSKRRTDGRTSLCPSVRSSFNAGS